MEYEKFLEKYVKKFQGIDFVYWPEKGFVVWKLATGENVELLHIRTFVYKRGYAKKLIKEMIKKLQSNPPYYSVFGFALSSRQELKSIYKKLGFNITDDIPAPYKDGNAFIFWQDFNILKKRYLEEK